MHLQMYTGDRLSPQTFSKTHSPERAPLRAWQRPSHVLMMYPPAHVTHGEHRHQSNIAVKQPYRLKASQRRPVPASTRVQLTSSTTNGSRGRWTPPSAAKLHGPRSICDAVSHTALTQAT